MVSKMVLLQDRPLNPEKFLNQVIVYCNMTALLELIYLINYVSALLEYTNLLSQKSRYLHAKCHHDSLHYASIINYLSPIVCVYYLLCACTQISIVNMIIYSSDVTSRSCDTRN